MTANNDRLPNKIRLIVAADEPALFFTSPERAEGYLEAQDVEDGTYPAAYGPQGEPYEIAATEDGDVIIARIEGAVADPNRLTAIIVGFLSAVGITPPVDAELDDLLQLCAPYIER